MIRTIAKWALLAALVAGVIYGIVAGYEWWRSGVYAEGDAAGAARVQKRFDDAKLEWAAQTIQEVSAARADEQRMAANAAKGERDARQKAERVAAAARADADRAAAAGSGMSTTIAGLNAAAAALGIPDAASCPAEFVRQRDAAVRARDVLGACSAAYIDLARAADEAFGALTLRLDTALNYIGAVQHAPP